MFQLIIFMYLQFDGNGGTCEALNLFTVALFVKDNPDYVNIPVNSCQDTSGQVYSIAHVDDIVRRD